MAAGADVDAANECCWTALHLATLCDNAVKKGGPDREALSRTGWEAAERRWEEELGLKAVQDMLELLLAYGANPELKTDDGKTVWDLSQRRQAAARLRIP
eukprot:767575-Hanusia_phi.AAC.5